MSNTIHLVLAMLAAFACICLGQSVLIQPGYQVKKVESPTVLLEFESNANLIYQVESSDDLISWKKEGYAFHGKGRAMNVVVSNHGEAKLFYRIRNDASLADTAPLNPYVLSTSSESLAGGALSWENIKDKPGTLDELGIATGTSELIREIGAGGYDSLTSDIKEIWRIVEKINRDREGGNDLYRDRFVSVSFGDSVACRIDRQAIGFWGYGGGDARLLDFVRDSEPVPTTKDASGYEEWAEGVYILYDEWNRVPGGVVVHLDDSIPGAAFVERTNFQAPMHSVIVSYMTKDSVGSGSGNYGSFKLQYKPGNEGSWIDCERADVINEQGAAIGGVVNTDSGSSEERIGVAVFELPRSDTHAIRLVVSEGRVRLTKVLFNNGGLNLGPDDQVQLGGSIDADFSLGGRGITSHFSKMTQSGLNDVLGYLDPHVVIYKSANEWALYRYEDEWPDLARRIMAAAPNAVLVVAGSHPQFIMPDHYDERAIEVDDYLREWCARTEGAIFVDVRQNFPSFQAGFEGESGSIDDLWSDGIHIGGSGEYVVSQLVWDAIKPAFEYAKLVQQSDRNWNNILPMTPSEIRLFDGRNVTNRTNKLALTVHPRMSSSLMIRSTDAAYYSYNQSWLNESGLYVRASTDVQPNALSLFSDGKTAITFGHHSSLHELQGLAVGVKNSHTVNAARASNGYRFRVPTPVYGKRSGLIVEGRHDSPFSTRLLGIDVNATDESEGSALWSWMEDGRVVYKGVGAGTGEMSFLYDVSGDNVTVTTPAKSGTLGVVPAYKNELSARNGGLVPGDNYWNTTTNSLKTILP